MTHAEAAIISAKMIIGSIWSRQKTLDLTNPLNRDESWIEVEKNPQALEFTISTLIIEMSALLEEKLDCSKLAHMFIIQTVLNQSKVEHKVKILKFLNDSAEFYKEHESPEKQIELMRKLDQELD